MVAVVPPWVSVGPAVRRMKRAPFQLIGRYVCVRVRRVWFLVWCGGTGGPRLLAYKSLGAKLNVFEAQRELQRATPVKKLTMAENEDDLPIATPEGGAWANVCPLLVERLTCCLYEGGEYRSVGRLTIEVYAGSWRAQLTEPDAQAVLSVTAEVPDALLPALEGLLGSPRCPWRHAPWLPAPKSRKKK